jgi:hypothetical protein
MATESLPAWANCRKLIWVQTLRHVHNRLGNNYKAVIRRKKPLAKYD